MSDSRGPVGRYGLALATAVRRARGTSLDMPKGSVVHVADRRPNPPGLPSATWHRTDDWSDSGQGEQLPFAFDALELM